MDDRWLVTKEVSEITRTPEGTLRYWHSKSPSYGPRAAKVGKRLLYKESEVRAWMDAQLEGSGR